MHLVKTQLLVDMEGEGGGGGGQPATPLHMPMLLYRVVRRCLG